LKVFCVLIICSTLSGCAYNEYDRFSSGEEVKEPTGAKHMNERLKYNQLAKIQREVHERFRYISDISKYGKIEHWPLFEEIPETGIFKDDCDGFVQMFRKELDKVGEKSIIQLVGINSNTVNHAVCRYGDWLIDNTHISPVRRTDVPEWTFIKHSNDDTTKWYKTK